MQYVGIQTQIWRNNIKSIILLLMFPVIILTTVWVFLAAVNYIVGTGVYDAEGNIVHNIDAALVNHYFIKVLPWVVGGVGLWFIIAYFGNVSMIEHSVGARPLSRKENPRVYNIVENLCISCGMKMPKLYIVDDPQLNAFASGINERTYAVTLTSGIISLLSDDELAGVVGHELTHIRNHDTKLLITSIVFVGIISTIMSLTVQFLYNSFWHIGGHSDDDDGKGNIAGIVAILAIGAVCCFIAYIFTLLTRFAISRKREYMADAGGAELTRNPLALASALEKISANPGLDNVKRADVSQLFICEPDKMSQGILGFMNSLFSTHPDTRKRIEVLRQF